MPAIARLLPLLLMLVAMSTAAEEFGVLDLQRFRHPQFIYDQPRLGRAGAESATPLYLHVPREQTRQWARYCTQYRACDHPAYFVSEEWYYGVYLGRAISTPEHGDVEGPAGDLEAVP